jgi:hypothetical protein
MALVAASGSEKAFLDELAQEPGTAPGSGAERLAPGAQHRILKKVAARKRSPSGGWREEFISG